MKLVTNPNKFFEKAVNSEIRLARPLLIILSIALLTSIYQYSIISKIAQTFPEDVAKFFMIGAYIGIIGTFVGIFAVWFIAGALLHAISGIFGGKGSFRRTFELAGYGFLPSLVGSVITVPLSLYCLSQANLPEITPETLQNPEAMKSLMFSIVPPDLLYSNLILSSAITLWSLTLWTFAVKHARNLPTRKAFVSALVPTVIFALYQFYSVASLL